MTPKITGRAASVVALLAVGSLAIACSSDPSSPQEGDGNSNVVSTGTSLVRVMRKQDGLVRTEAVTPAAGVNALKYFGGRVVSNVQVVQVLYGSGSYLSQVSSTARPSIATFYQDVSNSAYFDWLTEYNTNVSGGTNQTIGHGSFSKQVQITPAASRNGSTITDAQIQAELSAQIQAGTLPAPTHDAAGNNNTYYAVFFPHGKTITLSGSNSCQAGGFCAYHGTISNAGGKGEVYYGVHPDMQAGSGCDSGCGGSTTFNNETSVASHELVEMVTDAEVGLATTFGPPLAWYDQTDNQEIGDLCNAQQGTISAGGSTYTVQKEFDNATGSCIVTKSGGGGGGGCAHSDCSTGGALTSGCNSCVTSICAQDPFCCNTSWDSICVGEVGSICGQTCP